MKEKMVVFIICTLLIFSTTSLAYTTFNRNEKRMKQVFFNTTSSTLSISNGWMKTFGGTGDEMGFSVQQTNDRGYIITGYTDSYGEDILNIWLIKTNSYGIEEWNKTFVGWVGTSVQQTTDGGYIITGYSSSALLIKTDSNGNKLWNKTFEDMEHSNSVKQTTDGGYIIVGDTGTCFPDIILIKTDANGNKIWDKTFGGTKADYGYSIQQTTDDGYIITGIVNGTWHWEGGDVGLIKTDYNGNEIWDKTFNRTTYSEAGYSVQQTNDGGYIITGYTTPFNAGQEIWLIKTNNQGDETWNKTFGGIDYIETGFSVQQTNDGGYILVGVMDRPGGSKVLLIKTDSNGDKVWDKTFGETGFNYCYTVKQTKDGGYIITGETGSLDTPSIGDSDVWLIKTDSNGNANVTNKPPEKPIIIGQSGGTPGTEYEYKFMSTDFNGDKISYFIDWGDNTSTGWTELLPPRVYFNSSHIWYEPGNYTIKAKAKDISGDESELTTLTINIIKNKIKNIFLFLQRLLQHFPLFEKILNQII